MQSIGFAHTAALSMRCISCKKTKTTTKKIPTRCHLITRFIEERAPGKSTGFPGPFNIFFCGLCIIHGCLQKTVALFLNSCNVKSKSSPNEQFNRVKVCQITPQETRCATLQLIKLDFASLDDETIIILQPSELSNIFNRMRRQEAAVNNSSISLGCS